MDVGFLRVLHGLTEAPKPALTFNVSLNLKRSNTINQAPIHFSQKLMEKTLNTVEIIIDDANSDSPLL